MKVIYVGPIGTRNKPFKGGFEAANRKNIDMMERMGITVYEYPYPTINHKKGFFARLTYLKTFITPFQLYKYKKEKDNIIVHITPFLSFLYLPTWLLVLTSKFFGYKVIVDIRAGNFITMYKSKRAFDKKIINKVFKLSSGICVEGEFYKEKFCEMFGLLKHKIHYFPNLSPFPNQKIIQRNNDEINLFYFGRITVNKGIEIMIRLMELLGEKYHLYIAGNCDNTINISFLMQNKKITYLGVRSPIELKTIMERMHFFIFPTFHEGEGQSNSLIEAMSMGLIPIVSDNGFNKEVVGNCGAVIKNIMDPLFYKQAIENIVNNNLLEEEGQKSIRHINENHNLEKEIQNLIEFYSII